MTRYKNFIKDSYAFAVVEAAIIFPIMIMIFAGLVLLAMYLPTRAALQRATQYAATAIATEKSDTWLYFDTAAMTHYLFDTKSELNNVYVDLFKTVSPKSDEADKADVIVRKLENNGLSVKSGDLTVEYGVVNYVIYKEIVVTATRVIPSPVNLSFVGFPEEIPITVTSSAVVQNGDEFVRNMDMAVDFVEYISEKFGLSDIGDSISSFGNRVSSIFGW